MGSREFRVFKAFLVAMGLMGLTERRESKALLAAQVLMEHKVSKEFRVPQAQMVQTAVMVLPA